MRLLFLTLLNSEGPGAPGFLPIRCLLLPGNITLRHDSEQNGLTPQHLLTQKDEAGRGKKMLTK